MGRSTWRWGLLALAVHASLASAADPAPGPPSPAADAAAPASGGDGATGFAGLFRPEAWSGLFRLGRWSATLDLQADQSLQQSRTGSGATDDFQSGLTREGLTVGNHGFYVVDPRLLTGDLSARLSLVQGRQEARGQRVGHRGTATDYYFSASVLPTMPYSMSLSASRAQGLLALPGGGTSESVTAIKAVNLYLREDSMRRTRRRLPWFSASLQARDEGTQQLTTTAGNSFRRDERRRALRLDGHNGYETGDLHFRLEKIDVENRLFRAASFGGRSADVSFSVDLGERLNRQADTSLSYSARDGAAGTQSLLLDQRFDVEHNSFLSSNYGYSYQSLRSLAGTSVTQAVNGGLQAMPFLNVQSNLSAFGTRTTLGTGVVQSYGANGAVQYGNDIAWGGRMSLSLAAGRGYTDAALQSSRVPVVDARYQAPSPLGAGASILLRDRYIDVATIEVVDVRDGARLPTVQGVDYLVVVEGSRTRLVPSSTSAVILAGDPLEISYVYEVDPSVEAHTDSRSLSLGLDWDYVGVSLSHEETRPKAVGEQETGRLPRYTQDSLGIGSGYDAGLWAIRGEARASRYREPELTYDQRQVGAHLNYRPSFRWTLNLDATVSTTAFQTTQRQSRREDLGVGVAWTSDFGWWGEAQASHRRLRDSAIPSETITEVRARVRRKWTLLDFTASVGFGERRRSGGASQYVDVHLAAVRKF